MKSSQFQSLENHELAFKFMKEEGLFLVGIGPQVCAFYYCRTKNTYILIPFVYI